MRERAAGFLLRVSDEKAQDVQEGSDPTQGREVCAGRTPPPILPSSRAMRAVDSAAGASWRLMSVLPHPSLAVPPTPDNDVGAGLLNEEADASGIRDSDLKGCGRYKDLYVVWTQCRLLCGGSER